MLPGAYPQAIERDVLRDFVRVGDRSGQNTGGGLYRLFTLKVRSPFRAWSLPCEPERTLEWVVRGFGRPWRPRKTRPHQLCRSEPCLSWSETNLPPPRGPGATSAKPSATKLNAILLTGSPVRPFFRSRAGS